MIPSVVSENPEKPACQKATVFIGTLDLNNFKYLS
jgi:hypothetical protein